MQLPAAVVAPLQAHVDRTSAALTAARVLVAKQATAQRTAQVSASRAADGVRLADGVADLVPSFAGITDEFDAAQERADSLVADAERALDSVTADAADVQGDALDAQRRLDALRRAASTSAVTPTSEGASYRFGSGAGRSVSAQSLDRYLQSKASPISGSGTALLAAGVRYRIDPRLIVAIAGAESYFGVQLCAPFNAWGWGCPNGPVRFTSFDDAVARIAKGLRENYLDDGLTSVGEIHLRYAPPNAANDPTGLNFAWPDNVARFLIEQGGDPQAIEGPIAPSR